MLDAPPAMTEHGMTVF